MDDAGFDEVGFEAFYARTHDRLVASLAVLVGDVASASDAADEAFERALVRWDRVSAMDSPAGWTYRVALNAARRAGRRRAVERRLWARRRPAPEPLPESAVEIRELLDQLPPRQRAAMALRVLGDLTQAEIATALGVVRTTVQSALDDASRHLAALDDEAREHREVAPPATEVDARPDAPPDARPDERGEAHADAPGPS